MRWSVEMEEMEERTISKPPERTEMRWKPHCHENDPADGPHAREETVEDGACTCGGGHAEDSATDEES